MALLSGSHSGQASRTGTTCLKVCGIVEPAEIDTLAAARVDWVGLWLGVPGGPHDLPIERWRMLADRSAATDPGPAAVLVTFTKDAELLRDALADGSVQWVQLHGYPTPGTCSTVNPPVPS